MEKTKQKVRFVTNTSAMEFVNESYKGIVDDEPSLTVEGMSEPMEKILQRFQRGQAVPGTTVYYDSDTVSDLENFEPIKESEFDLSDLDQARQTMDQIKGEIKDKKQKELERKKLEEAQKLIDSQKKDDLKEAHLEPLGDGEK